MANARMERLGAQMEPHIELQTPTPLQSLTGLPPNRKLSPVKIENAPDTACTVQGSTNAKQGKVMVEYWREFVTDDTMM